MEQWCVDGRDEVVKRGSSMIPKNAEAEGFTQDLTGNLRGILVKRVSHEFVEDEKLQAERSCPKQYAECAINYAYFFEGVEVDNQGRYPMDVVAGAGHVPQGIDELLLTMVKGEKVEVWLDPAFAFRDHGFRGPKGGVPAHCPVKAAVELVEFENPMTTIERCVRAGEIKKEANALFSAGDLDSALKLYNKAYDRIGRSYEFRGPEEEAEKAKAEDRVTRLAILGNIATCWFKKDEWSKSAMYTSKALSVDPKYPKAIYRRAMIAMKRLDFDGAIKDLTLMKEEGLGDQAEVVRLLADAGRRNQTKV